MFCPATTCVGLHGCSGKAENIQIVEIPETALCPRNRVPLVFVDVNAVPGKLVTSNGIRVCIYIQSQKRSAFACVQHASPLGAHYWVPD